MGVGAAAAAVVDVEVDDVDVVVDAFVDGSCIAFGLNVCCGACTC